MNETSRAEDAATYLSDLKLQLAPFAAQHDPRFFYAEPAFMQRLDLLTHLTQFSDSLLVVYGRPGSGKTTLAEQYAAHAKESWRVVRVNGGDVDDPAELFATVAAGLGMAAEFDEDALPGRLVEHCKRLGEVATLPVVIIDDAQAMPPVVLQALTRLGGDPQLTLKKLRLVLFGTLDLATVLAQAGLAPALVPYVQTLEVPAFSDTQAAAYLMYRLTVAGYTGESPFSATEVKAIAKAAEGLPGHMNELAHQALLEHQGRDQAVQSFTTTSPATLLRWGVVGIGAGLCILAAVLWLRSPVDTPEEPLAKSDLEERPLPLPPQSHVGLITKPVEQAEPEAEPEAGPDSGPKVPEAPSSQPVVQPLPGAVPDEDTVVAVTPEAPVPQLLPVPEIVPAPVAQPEAPQQTGGFVILEPRPIVEPTAPAVAKPEPVEPPASKLPPPVKPAPVAKAPPAPKPVPAPPAAPKPETNADWTQREAWIRQRDGSHYTLQLLGSRSEAALHKFVQQYRLQGEIAYFHRIHKGDDWYTLIYGDFSNRDAAVKAISGLPAAIRKDKPWPRSFASVQEQLPRP